MTSPNTKQPRSIPTDTPAVWDLVFADMKERDMIGEKKHGVRLQPGNGRDVLKDAYQEALDLVAYLRQTIYERDNQSDIATLEQENRMLRARIGRLEGERDLLIAACEKASVVFANYSILHVKKAPPDYLKALNDKKHQQRLLDAIGQVQP